MVAERLFYLTQVLSTHVYHFKIYPLHASLLQPYCNPPLKITFLQPVIKFPCHEIMFSMISPSVLISNNII